MGKKRRKIAGSRTEQRFRVFVDYENSPESLDLVEDFNLDEVWIFVGRQQKKIPLEFVQRLQRLGRAVHWVAPGVVGKNALDFILAMYVGMHHVKAEEGIAFAILSADRGYDPLIEELARDDRLVVRVNPERPGRVKKSRRGGRRTKTSAPPSPTSPPAARKSGASPARAATSPRPTSPPAARKSGAGPARAATSPSPSPSAPPSSARGSGAAPVRADAANAREAAPGTALSTLVKRVAERLDRMTAERLPTRENALLKHVASQLPAGYQEKAASVVRALAKRRHLQIQAGTVTYPSR